MATGRTVLKNYRIYIDGREMSCYSRSFGPLSCTFEEGTDDAICYDIKGTLAGNATIGIGTLNGIFDNTANGIHALLKTPTQTRNVIIGVGVEGVPIKNAPAFVGQFNQLDYQTGPADNPVTATIQFANTSASSSSLQYARPWGTLLHAMSAETAANTAVGLDQLATTTKGGYMMYQVTAGDGTASIKVQHSTTTNLNASFTDLLSSGSLDMTGGGVSGVVALANNATAGRYVRFQVALGTATTLTFALAWVRGNQ